MRASWFHLAKGEYPRQARVGVPADRYEEHVSRRGFVGAVAMLYHRHGPSDWIEVPTTLARPPVLAASLIAPDRDDPAGLPIKLYVNEDLSIWWSQRRAPHPHGIRNLDGDQLFFVHEGVGTLETEFGHLRYGPGDFLFVPKTITYRMSPTTPNAILVIESKSPLEPYDIDAVGRHAPFDPSVMEIPEIHPSSDSGRGEFPVSYKFEDAMHRAVLAFDPFDVVGWKGDLFPFRLDIADVIPIHSERSHLAPSVGGIFQGAGFVIANLIPQPAIADLAAEELPSYHRNAEFDEFWFTHESGSGRFSGEFVVTHQGMIHGATEEARRKHQAARTPTDRRERAAVGIDTTRRLRPTPELLAQIDGGTS